MAADSDTTRISIVKEVAGAIPATPTWLILDLTDDGVAFDPNFQVSQSLDASRSELSGRMLGGQVSGDLSFELSYSAVFNELLSGLFANDWGDDLTHGIVGFDSDDMIAGTQKITYAIEKRFKVDDTPTYVYHRYLGCSVAALSLTIASNEIITGSVSLAGTEPSTASTEIAGSSYTAIDTWEKMASPELANISFAGLFDESTYCIPSFNFNINGNVEVQNCIGSKWATSRKLGKFAITMDGEILFADDATYQAFLNETSFVANLKVEDIEGTPNKHAYEFAMPNCKLSDCKVLAGSTGSSVLAQFSARAFRATSTPLIPIQLTRSTV